MLTRPFKHSEWHKGKKTRRRLPLSLLRQGLATSLSQSSAQSSDVLHGVIGGPRTTATKATLRRGYLFSFYITG
jgi:hypothetical protein